MEKYSEELKGKTVCMAMDGRSNIHNELIVCVTLPCDNNVYLLDSVDAESKHTSENLAKKEVQGEI